MKEQAYSDKEIIEGIQQGGVQQELCLKALFAGNTPWIFKAVKRHGLTEEEARDAYTDALIAVRRQILNGSFRGESKISTYLYKIYNNKCIDIIPEKKPATAGSRARNA